MKSAFGLVAKACGLMVLGVLAIGCSASTPAAPQVAAHEGAARCAGRIVTSDAELTTLAGCREVQGDLRVTDVTSLEPLAALERVKGELNISGNPELEDLEGLNALRQADALVVERNGLFTLSGLEAVEQIGRMWVSNNPRLISIGSLNHARYVGEVVIENNPRLSAHYGMLRGLERLPVHAVVEGNRGITPADTALLWQGGTRQVAAR